MQYKQKVLEYFVTLEKVMRSFAGLLLAGIKPQNSSLRDPARFRTKFGFADYEKSHRISRDAYFCARHMLKKAGTLFSYWHASREAGCTREELWRATALIRGLLKCSCLRYRHSSDKDVRTRAAGFLKNWDILFTFLRVEGIERTNNTAERAIRPAV